MISKHVLPILLISVVLGAGCTKKKDPAFPDGMGQDLLKIADYDGKTEKLTLQEAKGDVRYRSLDGIKAKKDGKKRVQIVKYESASKLLPKDLILTGIPSTEMILKYKITEKDLVLYKNGKPDQFPDEEKVLAESESDGTRSLEIASYDITGFYQIVIEKDDNGNKTSKLRENQISTKDGATHFKISRVPQVKSLPDFKNILVKASYFKGSWFTSSVISKTSEEDVGTLGFQVSYDSKYNTADKVTFVRTSTHLTGLNSNFDKRLSIKTDEDKLNNLTQVTKIPVEYLDFKDAKKADRNSVTDFEKNTQIKNWEDRQWLLLDFAKASSAIAESLPGVPTLVGFKMTDDFFMYSLQYNGMKVTISFLREKFISSRSSTPYTSRNALSDDFKYFGYFVTEKKALDTFERYRKESYEVNRFLNRFHPEDYTNSKGESRRRIRFVMTEESVSDGPMIEAVKKALASWDFAFKLVGLTDVDIYLDLSERAALGDLRFNSINLFKSLTASRLLGYGPSIADPDTGQIISATTNVHVTSIRDYIIFNLRNYIRHKSHEMDANYPLGVQSVTGAPGVALANTTKKVDLQASQVESGKQGKDFAGGVRVKRKSGLPIYGQEVCDFGATSGDLIKDIESSPGCRELVQFAESSDLRTGKGCKEKSCDENVLVLKCAEELLPNKMMGTLIHELGHNFGLRHNFAASSDRANYARRSAKAKDIYYCPMDSNGASRADLIARSSSVMDYTDINEDRLTTVGPYDIEAIRFGYAGKVLTQNAGSCLAIPLKSGVSIDENLRASNSSIFKLKYCSDEFVEVGFDPLCQRHDSGSTLSEAVDAAINQYNVLFASQNFKYDRAKSQSPSALLERKQQIFKRLKMIYESWRLLLVEFIGENASDLDHLNLESYQKKLAEIESKNDPRFKDAKEASRKIFDFFLKIAFLPEKYCVVQLPDGKVDLVELASLLQVSGSVSNGSEFTCTAPGVSAVLAKRGTFLREVGFYFEHQKAAKDPHTHLMDLLGSEGGKSYFDNLDNKKDEIDSYWDIVGSRLDKELAKDSLTQGSAYSYFTLQKRLKFSMLDEPDLREKFVRKIADRVISGIDPSDVYPEWKEKAGPQAVEFFPKWLTEKQHILRTWNYLTTFIKKVGKEVLNKERSKLWEKTKVDSLEKSAAYPENRKLELKNGSFFVAPEEENSLTIAFIARMKWLMKIQEERSPEYLGNQLDFDAQTDLLASILEIEVSDVKGSKQSKKPDPDQGNENYIAPDP